jgi:hypothetical protein
MVSEDMTQMEAPRIDSGKIAEVSHGLDRTEVERREKVFSVSDLSVAYRGNVALETSGDFCDAGVVDPRGFHLRHGVTTACGSGCEGR